MKTPKTSDYGSWRSPITADALLAGSIGLGAVQNSGEDVFWLEARPAEKGRNVLVQRRPDGTVRDVTPAPFNVRTRVHEYGGGAFLVTVDRVVYFSNFSDQQVYVQSVEQEPQQLTHTPDCRFADFVLDQPRQRLIAVGERHNAEEKEPENFLAAISLENGEVTAIATGHDFYSSPRLSPDGQKLAWITWDHPNMPWDATQLWLADIDQAGNLSNLKITAGQAGNESIHEPQWCPDGSLYFVGDRSDWWNLYRYHKGEVDNVFPLDAEFAYPHWVFGLRSYTFVDVDTIICTFTQDGAWQLGKLKPSRKQLSILGLPYSNYSSLCSDGKTVWFIGSGPTTPSAVVALAVEAQETEILKVASDFDLDPAYLARPQAINFSSNDGQIAHAWYYPPTNGDFQGPSDALPPLLVKSHGGPTAAAGNSLSLKIQYWTSRGFAYVDVNYGGSTGYGRDYRQRLNGQWGIVDVADCVNAARYLADQGLVDGEQLAISGGSAGGYTTLAALTFHNTFKAGASYYGVSDLTALATDTHKFEARYLDGLIGPYPEREDLYERRSPVNHANQLTCPVIFFQGLEDRVVPPNQTEMMVAALKAKGIKVEYVAFPEEQHGFRIAANIKKALESELAFYGEVFGFTPAAD
ncbi:S9 family peptidase [Synechocystis sp. PCC 7339]|uniref:S9 family peptidase n=1 Tax=Synechocystis sp. PCC 7339 TaxID=2782213 RepID=UPI001CBB6208|nr:S9 family peptidase [Synechocystis sp. PCC 7339]UAJ72164.1 S9 family peptidase [Synechocystis sp. PCC 7339]